jgi:hypothetical protein
MSQHLVATEPTSTGLDTAWAGIAAAGSWFSGTERIAIAEQTRAARACGLCVERRAALSPYSVSGQHEGQGPLSVPAVDAVHRISSDPGRLSEKWYAEALASGLLPEEVVEITGVVGVVTIADSLALALAQDPRPLPQPEAGEPSRARVPGAAVDERAWVPIVDPERAEGELKMVYDWAASGPGFVFNVARALTSVPEALRGFFSAFTPNYGTHGPVGPGGLNRSQVELLASATSAHNDCFY